MKILVGLSALLIITSGGFAQSDSCKINVVTNNVTHSRRAEINFTVVGTETDNLFCTAFRTGKDFAVYFGLEVFNKTICFNPGAKAMIIFTDHSQSQVTNIQAANCKGNFLIKGTIENGALTKKDSVLYQLTQKPIRAIRFQTTTGFLDYDVVDEDDRLSLTQAKSFARGLECLLEWKE